LNLYLVIYLDASGEECGSPVWSNESSDVFHPTFTIYPVVAKYALLRQRKATGHTTLRRYRPRNSPMGLMAGDTVDDHHPSTDGHRPERRL
jgi:hypothetical protein